MPASLTVEPASIFVLEFSRHARAGTQRLLGAALSGAGIVQRAQQRPQDTLLALGGSDCRVGGPDGSEDPVPERRCLAGSGHRHVRRYAQARSRSGSRGRRGRAAHGYRQHAGSWRASPPGTGSWRASPPGTRSCPRTSSIASSARSAPRSARFHPSPEKDIDPQFLGGFSATVRVPCGCPGPPIRVPPGLGSSRGCYHGGGRSPLMTRRVAPQRRPGEAKSVARQRWKSTGRCQTCGRKMKGRGRECSTCRAKRTKRYGPPDRHR